MLIPFLVGSILLYLIPALMALGLSFTRYDSLTAPEWVGFNNFATLADNKYFYTSVGNSLYYILLAIPLRVIGALALAVFLHRRRSGVKWTRIAVFLPTVIPDAAFALIGLWMFNPIYGPFNMMLGVLGLPQPSWLVDPATAKLVFVIMSLFQIGEGFVIMLAARSELPPEFYEAAQIAGGSKWQTFQHITLPLLTPWLILLCVRDIMMSFVTTFTQSHLMTQGDPYYATMFTSLSVYEEAFDRFHFGLASAMMVIVFGGCLLLVAGVVGIARRMRYGTAI